MQNDIVQSLWIEDEIGLIQRMCYNSYTQNGHTVHLYTYGTINNLPPGIVLKDANEIIKRKQVFKDFRSSYATFSDWFRIELLHHCGGWWVDSDTICLKKFDLIDDYAFATEVNQDQTIAICNAVLKMPKGSLFGQELIEKIQSILSSRDVLSINWTEIGSALIEKNLSKFGLDGYIISPEVFCPVNYFNFSRTYQPGQLELGEDTYAIHLWNKMWEWGNIMPESDFCSDSFIEKLKKRYA